MFARPVQQSAPAAPQQPPIPPMPPRAGAATGASSPSANAAGDPIENAITAAENAVNAANNAVAGRELRDQIRTEIRNNIRAQVAGQEGQPQIIVPPPYRNNDIPPEVIPIVGTVFGTLAAVILGYPIIRMLTRIIEKKADKSMLRATDVTVQLRALQESVDTMAIEIERISEAQRFQARLMNERAAALPSAEREGR